MGEKVYQRDATWTRNSRTGMDRAHVPRWHREAASGNGVAACNSRIILTMEQPAKAKNVVDLLCRRCFGGKQEKR